MPSTPLLLNTKRDRSIVSTVLVLGTLVAAAAGTAPTFAQPTLTNSVICRMGASAGARRYRPGSWSLVEVTTINQTTETSEAKAVLRFRDDPTLQFGRRVLVPPNSSLRSTCPVFVPEFIGSAYSFDFVTEQTEPSLNSSSTRSKREAVVVPQSRLLDHERVTVGMIGELLVGPPLDEERDYYTVMDQDPTFPDRIVYELVIAAKRGERLSRKVSELTPDELPADPAGLAVLDTIVLSSDRVTLDPGGVVVLRDWVLGGGRLWILLDQVDPNTVVSVLGDAFTTTIVDKTELTEARIRSARPDLRYRWTGTVEFDEAAPMVRVIPQDVTVTDTIDGWPAAFWQQFGAGRVYFTTVGPEAWMRPSRSTDPPPITEDDATAYYPREALRHFAAECMAPKSPEKLTEKSLRPFLSEQIGYRIIHRGSVLWILGAFCALIAATCFWFGRKGRAEHLLWTTPLAVIAASAVFLLIGSRTKTAVPPTAATIARVVLEPGLGTGHTFGLAAMYNQESSSGLLAATKGGIFFPDMSAMSGSTRLVTWTDEGSWHWETLSLPAGVRTAPFKYPIELRQPVDCRAKFGEHGIEGSVGPFPFSELEDALIAVPHQPSMSVRIREDGSFESGVKDVLASQEFVSGSMLNDDQRRRKAIYETLGAIEPKADAPMTPMLYAWASALDTGFIFPQPNQLGSTLLSIPMRLVRSPPGSKVRIPAPFIPYRAITGPRGSKSTAYFNSKHHWVESRQPASDWLRFQLPPSVLPLTLERAELSIDLRAPSRTFEVSVPTEEGPLVVTQLSSPIGSYSAVLDRPGMLQLDDDGGLRLVIRVSPDESTRSADSMQHAPWVIRSLQLTAAGTVLGTEE